MNTNAERVTAPSLAHKVAWLRDPACYPECPQAIEAIETHMSWVFLTPRYAYKLKKPVRYAFLDFSTLAARRHYAEEELRLNVALAPGVYYGVVALARDSTGGVRVEGAGEPLDWLVKMRRLPAARMLDRLISAHSVTPADLAPLAARLTDFYRAAPRCPLSAAAYSERYAQMLAANHAVLADPVFGLPADAVAGLHATLGAWLRDNTPLLAARAAAFLVEGHGDLRPEHVCLESPPVVFDCLEFNRDFRIVDIADELAALAMECERLGASFVGAVLFQVYTARTGDVPAPALRHFYQSYRAALRARLALLHTRELPPSAWARWQATAQEYLAVAQQHAAALRPSTFQ